MAVTNAVTDLLKSLGELLASVFGTAYALAQSFMSGLLGLFAGFFTFASDLTKGVFDLAGGIGKFAAGNAVVLAVIAVAGYAYTRFAQQPQQQGGKPVVSSAGAGKKRN